MGQFAGFLAENENIPRSKAPGIFSAFSIALHTSIEHDCWIIDSGATDHMTNKASNLHNFQTLSKPSHVSVANGKNAMVLGMGKVKLLSNNLESTALFVPTFPFQLLSIGKITRTLNCLIIFSPNSVVFQDSLTKKTIGEGFFLNGLYYLCKEPRLVKAFQVDSISSKDQQIWHQRLAHPSETVLLKLFPKKYQSSVMCDTCQFSKFTRLPFSSSMSRASKPFELVHSDVWGPTIESFDGYKYFVIFVDDFSRTTWLYLLK